jgi:hypothetical protein
LVEMAREAQDRAVRWRKMKNNDILVSGDLVINSTCLGGAVPWKDRWMAAYLGHRDSSCRLVYLVLSRTRHV